MKLPINLQSTDTPNLLQIQVGILTVFYSFGEPITFVQDGKAVTRNFSGTNPQSRNHLNRMEPNTGLRIEEALFFEQLSKAMLAACVRVGK